MKLSCLPVSFFEDLTSGRMSVVEWARLGASLGLDAVDLSILFIPGRSLTVAKDLWEQIAEAGMRVAMLTTYPDFTHPDPVQRKIELEQEVQAVQLAAALRADLIRVTAGQAHPQTGLVEGIGWAAEGLTQLVDQAGEMGVRLVYENHAKPGAWEYTDFSQPPEVFLEILSRVPPQLGVNFDTGNAMAFSENPLDLLEAVLDRVVSIHASDTAEKGVLRHVLLGTGATPFPAIFRRLHLAGWDGWICMEEVSNLGPTGVALAADYIRKAWKEAHA